MKNFMNFEGIMLGAAMLCDKVTDEGYNFEAGMKAQEEKDGKVEAAAVADGDVPRRENHGGRLGREFRSQPAEEELRGVAHADDPLDHVNRDRIDADDLEEIGPPPPLAHIYYIIEQREHAQRVGSGGEYEGRSPELLVDRL